MRTQLRIVAGTLRGRKLICHTDPTLRPMPDRVRQSLFDILGQAVPDRPFADLFAGSGAVGIEALSRGATHVLFVERDHSAAAAITGHLRTLGLTHQAAVIRADVYRWVERWPVPAEPITVFLGPPYADLERRPEAMAHVLASLQTRVAAGSVLVLQAEQESPSECLPDAAGWDVRHYGRTRLSFWVKNLEDKNGPLADGG